MEGHSVFTDLSDPRRPQKLSEMFSEIYDNQWTNAFECLSLEAKTGGDQSDRAIIKRLLDIIMDCYEFCKKESEKQRKRLMTSLLCFDDVETDPSKMLSQLTLTKLNDFIKSVAPELVTHVQRKFPKKEQVAALQIYQDRCLECCWYACIQTPSLYLRADFEVFDKDSHRGYQDQGTHVDFVVWPALYISQNGALLNKAVVQGCNENKGDQNNRTAVSSKGDLSAKHEPNNNIVSSNSENDVEGKHVARIQIGSNDGHGNIKANADKSASQDSTSGKQSSVLFGISPKDLENKKSLLKETKSFESPKQERKSTRQEQTNPPEKRFSSQDPNLRRTPSAILDVSAEELEDRKSTLKETKSTESKQQPKQIGNFNFG
ncbi:uncharacterized protein LOC125678323 [Ostrea edulis]|uniref:uncharacterized protein LOC125678323 n=1 Tax=Ostrea edulis TaxID=37623 RepID=UPI0024AFB735|nr:uncharacterized protein LOC125678323 [Ostrea edulis]XP_048772662.2 uncharacterized protein LOC125678323 [Ostrea edulis]